MNRKWGWLLCACLLVLSAGETFAQKTDVARAAEYREEREAIRQFDVQAPEVQGITWDFGGWYRLIYSKFDDTPIDRKLWENELRIWGQLDIGDIHQFYARLRMSYVDWGRGESFSGRDSDWVGPNLDQAWYRLRLGNLARKYELVSKDCSVDLDFKIGRQYIELGHGIVLSGIMDAVAIDIDGNYGSLRVFAARTFSSIENPDLTAPEYWHDDRHFFGFQASMRNVLPRHEPYVFAVVINDENEYTGGAPPAGQRFEYEPTYIGFGSHGYLVDDLGYWGEFVLQSGDSHSVGEDIDAYAFAARLEYTPDVLFFPEIEIEYGQASGDSDKGSATNTVGGNTAGTTDKGFLGYGYHDTGVAFAGRFANLRTIRLTGSFHPFSYWDAMKNLEIGASYYWFNKMKKNGGISDPLAGVADKDIGEEMDIFVSWRITSDLLFGVRYGIFKPGDAYANQDHRKYLLTGITYSF